MRPLPVLLAVVALGVAAVGCSGDDSTGDPATTRGPTLPADPLELGEVVPTTDDASDPAANGGSSDSVADATSGTAADTAGDASGDLAAEPALAEADGDAATVTATVAPTATKPWSVTPWVELDAPENCVCADGSDYRFFERRADPRRVVFLLEGGGACIDAASCRFDEQGTFFPNIGITIDVLTGRAGVFDLDRPDNPLGSHSIVYAPYCTGDFHLGSARVTEADGSVVNHNGYVNATAVLDHLLAGYPDVEEVVVAGISAGSVPAPLFAGLLADAYPDAEVVAFGDSSGAYREVPAADEAWNRRWGTGASIPAWPEAEDVTEDVWSVPGLSIAAGLHDPDVALARFDFAGDEVQGFYADLLGLGGAPVAALLEETEDQIEAAGVEVSAFVAPGTAHTILAADEFYTLDVDGVRLVDWFAELLVGDPDDVECTDCP